MYACDNPATFLPRVFRPGDVADERRGEGQVGGRCLRLVRTIFDARNSPPEVRLVLGEVVTLPGGWSSYPPHHHPQPEIYHYRFTHPQGFGHAEHGEDVFKVRQYDTIRILAGNDHAQVRRARLRHVLRLGDPPPARPALRRARSSRPSTRGR